MNIIQHAEKFLGKISQGWKEHLSSDGLQVVCFKDAPLEGANTFMTAGLSRHELNILDGKKVRQEMIFPVSGAGSSDVIASFLLYICELILRSHDAVLRGQVMRLPADVVIDAAVFFANDAEQNLAVWFGRIIHF